MTAYESPSMLVACELARFGRKVTASDLSDRSDPTVKALTSAACAYVADYNGRFDFLLAMRGAYQRYGGLTAGQAAGVLNCMNAELNRTHTLSVPVESEAPVEEPGASVPNGTYTVILDGANDYVTLRLKDATFGNFAAGTQIAQFLSGPDNESSYTGFAFVRGTSINVWKRYRQDGDGKSRILQALETLLHGDASEAGLRYALESGNCYRCNRTLTVPASINRGLGPDCAKVIGA